MSTLEDIISGFWRGWHRLLVWLGVLNDAPPIVANPKPTPAAPAPTPAPVAPSPVPAPSTSGPWNVGDTIGMQSDLTGNIADTSLRMKVLAEYHNSNGYWYVAEVTANADNPQNVGDQVGVAPGGGYYGVTSNG